MAARLANDKSPAPGFDRFDDTFSMGYEARARSGQYDARRLWRDLGYPPMGVVEAGRTAQIPVRRRLYARFGSTVSLLPDFCIPQRQVDHKWIQRALGFRACSLRGAKKLECEWASVCKAVKLKRMPGMKRSESR